MLTYPPRRVILRIVMLLRDSEIVKEVHNQLLNIEKKTKSEAKFADIDEEIKLPMAVGQAFMSGDINTLAKKRGVIKLQDRFFVSSLTGIL
ncbi:hypothetical protein ACQVPO_10615 [Bacillus cereus]